VLKDECCRKSSCWGIVVVEVRWIGKCVRFCGGLILGFVQSLPVSEKVGQRPLFDAIRRGIVGLLRAIELVKVVSFLPDILDFSLFAVLYHL
jgi:hypothetical protein